MRQIGKDFGAVAPIFRQRRIDLSARCDSTLASCCVAGSGGAHRLRAADDDRSYLPANMIQTIGRPVDFRRAISQNHSVCPCCFSLFLEFHDA
jgi:hypothetical protein